jgi:hypothetical protein
MTKGKMCRRRTLITRSRFGFAKKINLLIDVLEQVLKLFRILIRDAISRGIYDIDRKCEASGIGYEQLNTKHRLRSFLRSELETGCKGSAFESEKSLVYGWIHSRQEGV